MQAAEKERKRDTVTFFAFFGSKSDVIYAKRNKPWGVILEEVCTQLEIGVGADAVEAMQLHPTSLKSRGAATFPKPLPIDADTLVEDIPKEVSLAGALIKLELLHEEPLPGAVGTDPRIAHVFYSDIDKQLEVTNHLAVAAGARLADVKEAIGKALSVDLEELQVTLKDTYHGKFVTDLTPHLLEQLNDAQPAAIQAAVYEAASTPIGVTVANVLQVLAHMPPDTVNKPPAVVEEPEPVVSPQESAAARNNRRRLNRNNGLNDDYVSSDDSSDDDYSMINNSVTTYPAPIYNDLVVYNFSAHVVRVCQPRTINNHTTGWKPISHNHMLQELPARGYAVADRYLDAKAELGEQVVLSSYTGHLEYEYTVTDARTQVLIVTQDGAIVEQFSTFQVGTADIPEALKVVVPKNQVGPGVFALPVYQFCGRTDDFGAYLFDADVDQRLTVAELKASLLERMNAEGVGLRAGGEPAEHLRLVNMANGAVLMDH
eukprot:SAG22_NODE_3515_length_1668_cov_0.917145_1_plen_486_part_10